MSYHDADILIVCQQSTPKETLLAVGQGLAKAIGYSECDFIEAKGRRLQSLDVEANKYITRAGNAATISFPLDKLSAYLAASELPKPIGIRLEADKRHPVVVGGVSIRDDLFLNPSKDKPTGNAQFKAERTIAGLFAVGGMCLLLLGLVGTFFVGFIRTLRKPTQSGPTSRPDPKSLKEVQSAYDKTTQKALVVRLALLPLLFIPVLFGAKEHLEDGSGWIPYGVIHGIGNYAMLVPLMIVPMLLVGLVIKKRREKVSGVKPAEAEPEVRSMLLPIKFMFPGFILLMLIFVVSKMRPQLLYGVPLPVFRGVLAAVVVLPIICGIIAAVISARKSGTSLAAGDPDFDTVMALAATAGVKVGRVVLRNTTAPNASASIFRTVTVTKGAREKLTHEERRSVLAHEVGHLRYQHPQWLFLGSIVFIGLWIVMRLTTDGWMKAHLPDGIFFLWNGPLIGLFVFPIVMSAVFAPMRKKVEFAADRFAIEMVGDYATVARALAKVHLFNWSPPTLRRSHEALASHPPLMKRLDALALAASSLGLPIDNSTVEELMTGPAVT